MIAAAGSGERLGAGGPKAFVEVAGRPMLAWSLQAFAASESVERVVIAAPPGGEEQVASIAETVEIEFSVVPGGDARSNSVATGVADAETELVAVHDAARPLVTPGLIDEIVARLSANEDVAGVIAAVPSSDTLKEISVSRRVIRTLDRTRVWAAQTPQAFRAARLLAAYADADERDLAEATDDAMLVERIGEDVLLHQAPTDNIKITTPHDLRVAEMLLADAAGS